MTLTFHESALDDLAETWNYYSRTRGNVSADRVVEKIRVTCDLFVAHPKIGRERPDVVRGMRSFPCGDYVIYYFEDGNAVTVVRILHGARDIIGIEMEEP